MVVPEVPITVNVAVPFGVPVYVVAPLALGVDRVEHQRRLARPRHARHHREPVVWDLERDVFQVVDPRPD